MENNQSQNTYFGCLTSIFIFCLGVLSPCLMTATTHRSSILVGWNSFIKTYHLETLVNSKSSSIICIYWVGRDMWSEWMRKDFLKICKWIQMNWGIVKRQSVEGWISEGLFNSGTSWNMHKSQPMKEVWHTVIQPSAQKKSWTGYRVIQCKGSYSVLNSNQIK